MLTEAAVTPSAATYAYIIGSTPYRSPLVSDTRDFDPPASNEFVDGLQPVFYPVGGTVSAPDTYGYVRPLHTNDPDDTNNRDFMEVTHGGAFTVQVHLTGALLQPTLRASATTVRVGQSARLSASVSNPPPGETLDWTWNVANGNKDVDTGTKQALTTPPYTTPGTYYAQASVTGSNGSSGASNTVAITVKARSKTPAPRTTGPGRGAGPSTNPIGGPVTGAGSRYNGRPGASPTATGGPAPPTAAASHPASTSGTPTSGSSATIGSQLVRPSGGQLVAGFALVDPAGATSANQPVTAAPAAAAAARAGGQHVRASLAWVGVACILALLLAGAGLERRRARPGPLYGRKRWRHR